MPWTSDYADFLRNDVQIVRNLYDIPEHSRDQCNICRLPYGRTDDYPSNEELRVVENLEQLPFQPPNPIHKPLRLPCGHVFGEDCVREWFKSSNRCPLCMQQIFTPPAYGVTIFENLRQYYTVTIKWKIMSIRKIESLPVPHFPTIRVHPSVLLPDTVILLSQLELRNQPAHRFLTLYPLPWRERWEREIRRQIRRDTRENRAWMPDDSQFSSPEAAALQRVAQLFIMKQHKSYMHGQRFQRELLSEFAQYLPPPRDVHEEWARKLYAKCLATTFYLRGVSHPPELRQVVQNMVRQTMGAHGDPGDIKDSIVDLVAAELQRLAMDESLQFEAEEQT